MSVSATGTGAGTLPAPAKPARRRFRLPFSPWHLILIPTTLLFAAPLIWLVLTSFMTNAEINRFPPTIIPESIHFDGYKTIFGSANFPQLFLNSTIVATSCVISNLVLCSLGGYAFARMRFRGSGLLLGLILATLVVPLQLTMIPLFVIMKELGLVDTLAGLVVPSLVTPFGVFLLRQFFLNLPRELEEAAWIDGCSRLKILWTIVIPLAKPALATVAVLTFLGAWNDLLWPLIVISSQENYTLQLGLASFQGQQHLTDWAGLMAGNVITVLPTLIIFVIAQKTFLRSVASSGMTG